MNILDHIHDSQFELEDTNNHWRVPTHGGFWAIVTTVLAPGLYPIRGWIEDSAGEPLAWATSGVGISGQHSNFDLCERMLPRKIAIELSVTVDEAGRVVKCMQCLPKGLREVPVVTRILKREETGIIRGEIEVKS